MACENQGACGVRPAMTRKDAVAGFAIDLLIGMNEDAVVEHRDARWGEQFFAVIFGSDKDDVVGLPFARFAAGVHERRCLGVDGCALAIRTPLHIERVEDLDLVEAHYNNAVVSCVVPGPGPIRRGHPLYVQLNVAERLPAHQTSSARDKFTIFQCPCAWIPCGQIAPVEKYDGVGRDRSRRGRRAWINFSRSRPIRIVNQVIAPRQLRCVLIAKNPRSIFRVNKAIGQFREGSANTATKGKKEHEETHNRV